MAAALAKLSVGKPGLGPAHASYITRLSALDPDHKEGGDRDSTERNLALVMVQGDPSEPDIPRDRAIDDDPERGHGLPENRGSSEGDRDADPIWTWNAPDYITGDTYGMLPEGASKPSKNAQAHERMLADKMTSGAGHTKEKLPLKEKIENARCYFGSHEELEKAKGGRTHYRMVLSFDVPATNSQIRELTNEFLGQTFPKAMAFAVIHRDTDHPHVHVYIHSRQIDGKRINLKSQDYRTIDEKWSKIYSEFAGDRGIHAEHLRKKEETREWKRAAAIAYQRGEKIPQKPERDNDRRERLAEQRLSGQRSAARDRGEQLGSRPPAEPVMRPWSERETGRMLAMEHLGRERLAHLIRTDAPHKEIEIAARNAQGLKAAMEKTIQAREQMGKSKLPAAAYTIEEGRQLAEYHASRDLVRDERTGPRLVAQDKIAAAELMHAERKAEAFEARRHLWKFEMEGQDNKLSLRDIERSIDQKKGERLEVFNFIRPSRREAIESQIDYLGELKRDVQERLSARAQMIDRDVKAAELRQEIAAKQVEIASSRGAQRPAMPGPSYTTEELNRLSDIANFTRDPELIRHIHEVSFADTPANAETAGLMVGRSLMAKLEMLKAHDRRQTAYKYQRARHAPIRDAQGLDHAKSPRQVEPRTAVELVIRHFTDTPEQKQELQNVREASNEQVRQAQAELLRAQQYLEVREEIARDYCRAAGTAPNQIAPILDREQMQEMKLYAQKLPGRSSQRREFERAISLAERGLEHGGAVPSRTRELPSATEIKAADQRPIGQPPRAVDRLLNVVGIGPPGQQQKDERNSHEQRPDRGSDRSVRSVGANRANGQPYTDHHEPGRDSRAVGADTGSPGRAMPKDRAGTGQDRTRIQPAKDRNEADRHRGRQSIPGVPGAHAEGHDRDQAGGDPMREGGGTVRPPRPGSDPATSEYNIQRGGISEAPRAGVDRLDTAGGAGVYKDVREVEGGHQSAEVRERPPNPVDRGSGAAGNPTRGADSVPTDTRTTATARNNQPGRQLSALERLQKMVGIETQREKVERERLAKLFQIDRNDPSQRAGIARGEYMVRAVEYDRLMKTDPERASQQKAMIWERRTQAIAAIDEYREQTGREPAPILTVEQRDYITANRDPVDSQAQREALRGGLERATIEGESSRGVSLDYERPESRTKETKIEPEPERDRGESFRGR